jgi:hypothetical protein
MSALAARRAAAAAASTSSSPAPSLDPTTSTSTRAQTAQSSAKLKTPRPPPKSPSVGSSSSSEAEYAEAVSSINTRTPNKRRKIEGSPPMKQRYFAHAEPTPKSRSRAKAFSPSAPAETEDVEAEAGDDSSEEEITFEDEEAAAEVDEGTIRWTSAVSAPPTPRPDRMERVSVKRGDVGTSNFEAMDGVNYVAVSSHVLLAAGLKGEGPGVVVSLTEGEVGCLGYGKPQSSFPDTDDCWLLHPYLTATTAQTAVGYDLPRIGCLISRLRACIASRPNA